MEYDMEGEPESPSQRPHQRDQEEDDTDADASLDVTSGMSKDQISDHSENLPTKSGVFKFKMPRFAWSNEHASDNQKHIDGSSESLKKSTTNEEDAQSKKPKPILKSRISDGEENRQDEQEENYEVDLNNNSEKKWNSFGWFRSQSRPPEEEPVHEVNEAIAVVSLRHLETRIYRLRLLIMVLSLVGLGAGIWVHEYCWLGYIPTPEEEAGSCSNGFHLNQTSCIQAGFSWASGIPNPLDTEEAICRDGTSQGLKSLCTILTVILIIVIFHMYQCLGRSICMRNHLEYKGPLINLPFWSLGLSKEFCMEFLVCLVHPIPLLSFTFAIQAEGRVSVYRVESVLVSLMFLRLYTVWRYFREWLFARYTSKHIVSRMSDIAMDSRLAIKAILDDRPFETTIFVFLFSAIVLAYLVRIAEAPVNVQQLYFWNQLWLVVVTSTSVGYGDIYPQTNLGRFLCFIAMVVGAFLTAVLIVSVSSKLALNAGESRLLQFLQSEKFEKDVKIAATRSIQFWWRLSIQHPRTLQALREFRNKKKAYRKFLEATPHFGIFVQQMKEDQGRVVETLSKIESKVEPKSAAESSPPAKNKYPAVTAQVYDDLMAQMLQLQKTNEQLMEIVAQARTNNQGGGAEVLVQHAFGGHGFGKHPSMAGSRQGEDPVLIASAAVEERIKRMEAQIVNLDKGMAKCLGQVVRLIQGLY